MVTASQTLEPEAAEFLASTFPALVRNGTNIPIAALAYDAATDEAAFWKLVPDERYVANPAKGSRHSRGAAVDLALADTDGTLLAMPTAFDDFSEKAHRKIALAGKAGREAKRLEAAMTKAGFIGMPTEWWHFDAPDASKYALSDVPL